MGHGDHASRRLGAALRPLKGPADKLTPLLKGLDAAELMSLPPPDASYRVVYEVEDSATAALRKELGGLRLMALQKRATSAGISDEALESAMESHDPKAALTELLLKQHISMATAEDEAHQVLRD